MTEVVGFVLAIVVCWLTEIFDPPFSYQQVLTESVVIFALGLAVIHFTRGLMRKISYLEGFLMMCAWCKRVRLDDTWVDIETILSARSDLQVSHGICPRCADAEYGDLLRR